MSNTAKTGIILVVILAIVVLVWAWKGHSSPAPAAPTVSQSPVQQEVVNTPTPLSAKIQGTGMSDTGDSSSAALETDEAALDAQIKNLNTDSANVDSVVNNQP